MPTVQPAAVPLPDAACALAASLLMLVAGGWLLSRLPAMPHAQGRAQTVQVRWLLPAPPPASAPLAVVVPVPGQPSVGSAVGAAPAAPLAAMAPPPSTKPATRRTQIVSPPQVAAPAGLFDAGGRVQLPAARQGDGLERRSTAQRVFEQRDETAFEHPDRGLFERAQSASTAQSRTQRAVFGRDVQAAQARQAPALAFNPRLHERPSDLADADGPQAYLAAPIADASAPGLEGQASARLLPEQAQRRARVHACRLPSVSAAWTALELHLGQLQQAEYRMGHGSSPEERRHTLPNEIARQYNLARRALWQVDHGLPGCGQAAG